MSYYNYSPVKISRKELFGNPDETTSSMVPNIIAGSDETMGVIFNSTPNDIPSSTMPNNTTSSMMPNITTSSMMPNNTTSFSIDTSSSVMPNNTTSSMVSNITTSSMMPNNTTSSTIPTDTTSSTVSNITSSSTIPNNINPNVRTTARVRTFGREIKWNPGIVSMIFFFFGAIPTMIALVVIIVRLVRIIVRLVGGRVLNEEEKEGEEIPGVLYVVGSFGAILTTIGILVAYNIIPLEEREEVY